MYVGYLRAEEQPTIDFKKLKNTFHMMLGLGRFVLHFPPQAHTARGQETCIHPFVEDRRLASAHL